MKVPIFTDEVGQAGGWHGAELAKAFSVRGYEAVFVNLQDCVIDLSESQPKITIPFLEELPTLAFVRGVAAGSLQQVITRLNVLHVLRQQGVVVYNDAKAIERTVDKGMTSYILKHHAIPTPKTWVCESRHAAHAVIHQHVSNEQSLVIKPLFGSQGKGVRLLQAESDLPLPGDHHVDGVYYLQEFIDSGDAYYDYRVFIVNHRAIASMRRKGTGWLNNVAQGAQYDEVVEESVHVLAQQASQALDIDYCGVDIICGRDGALRVLEVNSIPAWKGLQTITDINVAQVLVDDLIRKCDG